MKFTITLDALAFSVLSSLALKPISGAYLDVKNIGRFNQPCVDDSRLP
jgi:hypothetical protein